MKGKHSKAFDEGKVCRKCPLPYCIFDTSREADCGILKQARK